MNKSISSALCLIAIFVASISPVSAIATGETVATAMTVAAVTGTDGSVTPTDPASTEGLSLTPDEIAALQNQSEATSSDSNKSVFTKASDFVSDHAPFFIIGIIVLAAILAGIFIARGRRKVVPEPTTPIPVAAAGAAAKAAGPPAAVPSTKELRRQKRAAAQEAREQERRRRKAGFDGRSRKAAPPIATDVGPLVSASTASMALDPIEAEKRAARNPPAIAPSPAPSPPPASVATPSTSRSLSTPAATVVAGAAVGAAVGAGAGATSFNPGPGTGAIPAPVSPSQTAPAAGIQTPDQVAAASIQNPDDTIYSPQGEAVAEAAGAAPDPIPEPPTQVTQPAESSFDSPEPDARVGEAAAGFAVGAAGGSIAANAVSSNEEEISPVAAPVSDPGAADAEQRLRAKVDEIKAGQPRLPGPAPAVPVPVPEPLTDPVADQLAEEADADLERKRVQAEAVRREIDELQPTVEPIGGTSNLEGVERRLVENRENRDRTLQIAEDRLRLIEERAEQAERRAAFAERLTKLNLEESEREQRLNDVLTGIDRAEERTLEAEARAEAAERAATAAIENQAPSVPAEPATSIPPVEPPAPAPARDGLLEEAPGESEEVAASLPPQNKPSFLSSPAPAQPAAPTKPASPFGGIFSSEAKTSGLNLNTATFEELREADLSVTQATRILAYRERFGGYGSIEDLEKVPGFPADVIESLRDRITV